MKGVFRISVKDDVNVHLLMLVQVVDTVEEAVDYVLTKESIY